ncbi:hypothetical protein FHS07_001888 [Microbacterium proteolyticum]|uniref:Uncharacterized protein n=1 Tax=Microbacterium proteolyticum TaxID=1572644 RepID=A0A7W5CI93_9MICO|nr:hypothetical protein [Microbacterium proteolyticum]MBB3158192.1 hypothetical protein [Microbacterium proteolyticum]
MSDQATGAVPDPESLRRLISKLREFPPAVRTPVRRELRALGAPVIDAQKAVLDGELPRGLVKTGFRHKIVHSKRKGKFYTVKQNTYAERDVKRGGRSTGMRSKIKAGLKFRIVAGKTRQGIEFKTTGPKGADGFNKAKFWQKRRFRHPVFGRRGQFVDQAGQPFFRAPVIQGREQLLRATEDIITRAAQET